MLLQYLLKRQHSRVQVIHEIPAFSDDIFLTQMTEKLISKGVLLDPIPANKNELTGGVKVRDSLDSSN